MWTIILSEIVVFEFILKGIWSGASQCNLCNTLQIKAWRIPTHVHGQQWKSSSNRTSWSFQESLTMQKVQWCPRPRVGSAPLWMRCLAWVQMIMASISGWMPPVWGLFRRRSTTTFWHASLASFRIGQRIRFASSSTRIGQPKWTRGPVVCFSFLL